MDTPGYAAHDSSTTRQAPKPLIPIAYDPRGAAEAVGKSHQTIYDWMNSGRLRAKKDGKSTIILAEWLREAIESLPDYPRKAA